MPHNETVTVRTLERRLAAFEDRAEVEGLVTRYAYLLDGEGTEEELLALFTDDARLESPAVGSVQGRDAITEWARRTLPLRRTVKMRHFVTNLQTDIEGDRAKVVAYLLEAVSYMSPMPGHGSVTEVAYAGDFVFGARRVNGRWLLDHRLARLDSGPQQK